MVTYATQAERDLAEQAKANAEKKKRQEAERAKRNQDVARNYRLPVKPK
jgi:hypothetical protein